MGRLVVFSVYRNQGLNALVMLNTTISVAGAFLLIYG